jgi:hypothetical protein
VEWIPFYEGDALAVAASPIVDLPPDSHLHWVTPLALGGVTEEANLTVLAREQHMIGHALL